jgi:predicted phosphodiesterase
MNRRGFMKQAAQMSVGLTTLATGVTGCRSDEKADSRRPAARPLRFGVCADVHKGVIHDADERMQTFVDRMKREKVDFVMQMGDFCTPYPDDNIELAPSNARFLAIWNTFPGPRYHVLGNHDNDGDFTWEQTMAFWGMEQRYYSFDRGGYHFVILDGNELHENRAPGYPRYIGPDQVKWLREDLAETKLPTLIFSHQSLENSEGVENAADIRAVLEEANKHAGFQKVAGSFSGHHHIDYQKAINGIHYIQINSMSYFWVGGDYIRERFSKEVEQKNPWVRYTAPYQDPLYAIFTLEPGVIKIEGTRTHWISPSPEEMNYPPKEEGNRLSTIISDRVINII